MFLKVTQYELLYIVQCGLRGGESGVGEKEREDIVLSLDTS